MTEIPDNRYYKITRKQFDSLPAIAIKTIWRLYQKKKSSGRADLYIMQINKVLLHELKKLKKE